MGSVSSPVKKKGKGRQRKEKKKIGLFHINHFFPIFSTFFSFFFLFYSFTLKGPFVLFLLLFFQFMKIWDKLY
jgi:hypothetical protein